MSFASVVQTAAGANPSFKPTSSTASSSSSSSSSAVPNTSSLPLPSTYITQGDTPICDYCHTYYSERACEDCDMSLCTWCNIDVHEPIGKRNHYRPRLYGEEPYDPIGNPIQLEGHASSHHNSHDNTNASHSNGGDGASTTSSLLGSDASSRTVMINGKPVIVEEDGIRVTMTYRQYLSVPMEEAWAVIADFAAPFFNTHSASALQANKQLYIQDCMTSREDEEVRVLKLLNPQASQNNEQAKLANNNNNNNNNSNNNYIQVTERLVECDEEKKILSYRRLVPPGVYYYSDYYSVLSFTPGDDPIYADESSFLLWNITVQPITKLHLQQTIEQVQAEQAALIPYFRRAVEGDDEDEEDEEDDDEDEPEEDADADEQK